MNNRERVKVPLRALNKMRGKYVCLTHQYLQSGYYTISRKTFNAYIVIQAPHSFGKEDFLWSIVHTWTMVRHAQVHKMCWSVIRVPCMISS